MRREGEDGYRLSFFLIGSREPHTVVRADRDTTKVVVHLDERMLRVNPRTATGEESPVSADPVLPDPVRYPLDQLLLMNHLASRGGVIVHAAGAVIDGRGLVFPGVSGAGKSSLCRVLLEAGWGDSLLSDDRIILCSAADGDAGESGGAGEAGGAWTGGARTVAATTAPRSGGRFDAWGTPWPGDAGIARNACAPLAALLFLVKAEVDEVVPLAPGAAMRRLMPVVSCPWYDGERAGLVLDTCARIVEATLCYDLRFRLGGGVVDLLGGRSWEPPAVRSDGWVGRAP